MKLILIVAILIIARHKKMMFRIEFFRIRKEDNARAMLDRITHIASDLESAKVKAKSLFETLNMPEPRWLADFGPVWARGVFLDAEDGGSSDVLLTP